MTDLTAPRAGGVWFARAKEKAKWRCQQCGAAAPNGHRYHHTRQYCDDCKKKRNRARDKAYAVPGRDWALNSWTKGLNFELAMVRRLQDAGLTAEHVGATSEFDIAVSLFGDCRRVETKVRATLHFGYLYRWLGKADFLILYREGKYPLVVAPLDFALKLAQSAVRQQTKVPPHATAANDNDEQQTVPLETTF